MSLKVRLARGGSKKDAHNHEDGKRFIIDAVRLEKWMSNGAQLTETVTRLCIKNGIAGLEKYLPKHGESKNKGIKKKDRQKAN